MTRMKDSGIEWIGEVPEEWGITKLKYICGMQSGNNLTSLEISSESDGGNIFPVYGGNGQRGYYSDFRNEGNYCLVGRQGALAGNVHFVSGKFWATDHAIVVYEYIHTYSKYLYYLLKVMNLNQYAFETSAQPGLSVEKILQLETIHCPKGEQSQIADFLDKKVAQLDKVKSLLEEQIKTLEDYRQSLIYETVTKGLDKTVPLKDSGVDWIGQIPEGWGITKIKFTTQLNGRIGWQGLTSAEYKEEGPYLITGTDFLDGKINFETAVHIDEKRWFEAKQIQVENGDLLITKDGTVGKVAIIEGLNERASLNSGVLRIQTTENISRRFLFYVLKSDVFWLWFNYTNSGASTILHLYQNVFDEFSFTLPNVSEQNQIIDFLDKKTEQINQMIAIKKEQIENINKQRQTLIYDVVTGKRRV